MNEDDEIQPHESAGDTDRDSGSGPVTERNPHALRSVGEPWPGTRDGHMLAALLQVHDEGLEAFRAEHMGAVSSASDEDLQRARHLLRALVSAVREGSGERWRLVEAACDAIETTYRPGNTERPPPPQVELEDDDADQSDDGDRPTTPPAAPHLASLSAGWAEPYDALQPAPVPNLGSAHAGATSAGTTQHGHADPSTPGWGPSQSPAPSPAQPSHPGQLAAEAPSAWGQAYAPGSLPASVASPQLSAPFPPPAVAPLALAPSASPAPAPPYGHAAVPPAAAPMSPGYDQASLSSHDRAPTPPLFAPERPAPPPASARTPVAALPEEDPSERIPPSERTAPHTPSPTPSPPATAAVGSAPPPARSSSGGTAELTYGSQAHALALSLEEYAALCAARDLASPERVKDVERGYEIYDERTRAAVDRAFELRLAREPGERNRFQQIYREISARICDHTP